MKKELVYVIVMNWAYLLVSKEVARLLLLTPNNNTDCRRRIFVAIPDSINNKRNQLSWIKELQNELEEFVLCDNNNNNNNINSSSQHHDINDDYDNDDDDVILEHISYNPGDTKESCFKASIDLVNQIQQKMMTNNNNIQLKIDGLFYNWHGGIPGRSTEVIQIIDDDNGGGHGQQQQLLLYMAQYKLIGLFILLDTLINKQQLLSKGSRVVIAGSEASRGIPGDMNFPIPIFDDDDDDNNNEETLFISILQGESSRLLTKKKKEEEENNKKPKIDPHTIYAYIEAILALYIGSMARKYPNIYFCTISPGFTQDSLHYTSSLIPGFKSWLLILFYKLIFSPFLVKQKIGQDYSIPAQHIFEAMVGSSGGEFHIHKAKHDGSFIKSGIILGAYQGKVSGPICDQTTIIPGGYQLADKIKQDYAYKAIQHFCSTEEDNLT